MPSDFAEPYMAPVRNPFCKVFLVLFLVVSCIGACATSGRNFDQKKLERIRIGVHTKADVESLFGKPYMTSADPYGNEMWSYNYILATPFRVVENKYVYFFFSKGILSSYRTLGEGFEHVDLPQHKVKLGVAVSDAYKGVEIIKVFKNSPAERAGLQKGDIILRIDNEEIEVQARVVGILSTKHEGDEMIFVIVRDDKEIEVPVKL